MKLKKQTSNYNQENRKPHETNEQRPTSAHIISQMDGEKNGKLSKNEAKAPIADDFDNIDSKDNGFLTLDEFNKAVENQRNRRKDK